MAPAHPAEAQAPLPPRHSIIEVVGTSYYVDDQGIRHWLATGSDWSCATYDLRARSQKVRGWVAARFPVGPAFVCPG